MVKFDVKNTNFLLNMYFKIGGCLGMFPLLVNRKYFNVLHKMALICLYITFGFGLYHFFSFRFRNLDIQSFVPIVTNVLWYSSDFLFLYQTIKSKNSWENLYKCLANTERKHFYNDLSTKKDIATFILFLITAIYIIYFSSRIINVYIFISVSSNIQWTLTYLQFLVITFTVADLCNNLNKKCHCIQMQLDWIFLSYSLSRNNLTDKINDIKFICKNLYVLSIQLNNIFGIPMLVLFIVTFFEMLLVCNWVMKAVCNMVNPEKYLINATLPLLIMLAISSIVMVLSCDKIEEKSNELVKHCYTLQPDVKDPILLKQLIELAEFMKELRPQMWISGYFRVNKRLIPVMISTLASYLIIIIQFNKV